MSNYQNVNETKRCFASKREHCFKFEIEAQNTWDLPLDDMCKHSAVWKSCNTPSITSQNKNYEIILVDNQLFSSYFAFGSYVDLLSKYTKIKCIAFIRETDSQKCSNRYLIVYQIVDKRKIWINLDRIMSIYLRIHCLIIDRENNIHPICTELTKQGYYLYMMILRWEHFIGIEWIDCRAS